MREGSLSKQQTRLAAVESDARALEAEARRLRTQVATGGDRAAELERSVRSHQEREAAARKEAERRGEQVRVLQESVGALETRFATAEAKLVDANDLAAQAQTVRFICYALILAHI